MDKIELIKRNTNEIIGIEELETLLKGKKKPVAYLGTAPTGRPHVGYFVWALKVADLLKAGFHVKILLADLHAALDNTPWEVLEKRYLFYSKIIPLLIQAMGVNTKELEFVKGSSFQLEKDYILDLFKISSLVSVHDSEKAASEVVKVGASPKLSGIIYPLMQAIDEEYLKCDVQLGGTDQRKIMVLAREYLPKLGYKKRIEMMNPLLPGLIGKKMSSSIEGTKIDLMDPSKIVKKKINSADCFAGDPDNGLMSFLKYVVMTLKEDKKEKFVIERPENFGGNLEYSTYSEIEEDFVSKKLHPLDLKNGVAAEIIKLLFLIEENREELERLSKEAY